MEVKGVVAASQPKWIPVTEQLPDTFKNVLVFLDDDSVPPEDSIDVDFLDTYAKWVWNRLDNITHWMPLPAPPKVGD